MLLLVGQPARADAATTAQNLSAAGQDAFDAQVAIDAHGDGLVVWSRFDGANTRVQARRRGVAGNLAVAQTLSDTGQDAFEPKVAIDYDGDGVVVWRRFDGANWRIQAMGRARNGALAPVQTLSAAGQDAFGPQVAIDAYGDAVVAWLRSDGANTRVQARGRARDGTLGPVQNLSAAGQNAFGPQLAVDAFGDAVVVWPRFDGTNTRVQARGRASDGTLGPVQTLSASGQPADRPQVAIDDDGDGVVVWRRFDGANWRIQARGRASEGTLAPVQTLSAAGRWVDHPQVAIDGVGDGMVVWQSFDGANTRIQARGRVVDGTLGPVQTLSAAGQPADLPQVAMDADGDGVVAWMRDDGANQRIQARGRTSDGSLGAVKTLSAAGQNAFLPQVAVRAWSGDADGAGVVVWQRSDGKNEIVQAVPAP